MTQTIPGDALDPQTVKGFLADDEGQALARHALAAAQAAPGAFVEVGSWCGRSSVYLGRAAREAGRVLFAIDHHRGSEEHQPGEGYHDPELFDADLGRVDTLPALRRTVALADLEQSVVPVVGPSAIIGANWSAPLSFVFIDGGHAMHTALADYRAWAGHVARGGLLAIHDVFPNPEDGGRPPYEIWKLAVASGLFEPVERVNTLEILRRL
ncbi:class I SAM-dependent methyltransferase [Oceanicaulis sp. LC35]|uniref:class I SAM-dependent methyltransferase n=1 Tax=Oceanicaulis sp. LC35 TaxID=3349635 RepID=UPI003F847DE8